MDQRRDLQRDNECSKQPGTGRQKMVDGGPAGRVFHERPGPGDNLTQGSGP